MPTINPHLTTLSDAQQQALHALLTGFESSWDEGRLAACAGHFPPGSPLRRPALLAMIKEDLKRQWQRGRRPTVEAYLHFYPDLGPAENLPGDLLLAEYEARQRAGVPADLAAFARRFPRQAEELRARLEKPRGDTAAPGETGRAEPGRPAPPASSRDGALPEQFGRYRIVRKLGQGGMGAVYLAHDGQLERQVALKVPRFPPEEGSQVLERFFREARAAATLEHPNICPVYDVGAIDGTHYLTMAYVEGQPLSRLVGPGRPLPQAQAAALVRQLALALQEAHRHGIIHRDLKPSNVMMRNGQQPILMDFGLARRVNQEESRLTQAGTILGTPAYMSPEQVTGDLTTMGPASDIYSLGVILYELLTGRLPYEGPVAAVLGQILSREPPPPSLHRPDLDPRLQAVCLRAMARRIEDRFGSMAEMAAALDGELPAAGQVSPVATATYVAAPPRDTQTVVPPALPTQGAVPDFPGPSRGTRLWWLVGGGAAAVVLLGIVLILVLGGGKGATGPDERDPRRQEALAARTEAEAAMREARQARAPDEAKASWQKAGEKLSEARAAFDAGDFARARQGWKEAADQFQEARGQAEQAARHADLAPLKWQALDAGLEMCTYILSSLMADTDLSQEEKDRFRQLALASGGRVRPKLKALQVSEETIRHLLDKRIWTTDHASEFQQEVPEQVARAKGKEAGASFRVGIQLAWLLGGLTAETKAPGSVKQSAFLEFVAKARAAAAEAGYPQEMFDVLDQIAEGFSSGKVEEARALLEKLIDKLSGEEKGTEFLRQPKGAPSKK